ncbi:MAG: carboxylesterase family protein [Ferruginibacter sp.]
MKIKGFLLSVITTIVFLHTHAQIVNTQFGQVQGSMNGNVYQFLGIPFAAPPVGPLRWKAPQNPLTWTGTINTTAFAAECPQKRFQQGNSAGTITGNEDCLYLNIWTPQIGSGNNPVLLFIHGGGNQQGSANEINGGTQMYFGKNMAERGPAVIVSIQYRLGPLGFLVHPGLEPENANNVSGNYAVLDQILALNWVKNNIANFGGDPSKVMIFGESAGGVDVGNLLTTPLAAGLFQRACIQSAVPVLNDYNDSRSKGIDYVNDFTTAGTDVQKIAYLRSLPSDTLVKYEVAPLNGGAVSLSWQAVVDQVVFSAFPSQVFQSGNFNKVPLIIGSNSEEMSLSAPPTVTPLMVTALINSTVPPALRPQANLLYPPGSDNDEARQSFIGILTDGQFTATTRRTASCISLNQSEPVWRYFFTHKHTIPVLSDLGSYHGMEIFYVFNNWENATLGMGPFFHAQDDSVQNVMLRYWVNFANSGNPNASGLQSWPEYESLSDCYLEIKATPDGTQCGLRTAQSDLWDNSIGYSPCITVVPVTITSFNATTSNCTALLTWKTSNEQNVKEYDLEYSADGNNFSGVANIQSNNLMSESTYQYNYSPGTSEHNFFRLKIIDHDQRYSYSDIVEVKGACPGKFTMNILPNPVTGKLYATLNIPSLCKTHIEVFNAAGGLVYNETRAFNSGENKFQLNEVENISKGIYLLKVKNQYGTITQRFIKL